MVDSNNRRGGNIRSACDSCHRLKTACDKTLPCRGCKARNIKCIYPNRSPVRTVKSDMVPGATVFRISKTVEEQSTSLPVVSPQQADVNSSQSPGISSEELKAEVDPKDTQQASTTFTFLYKNIGCAGLLSTFECCSDEQRWRVLHGLDNRNSATTLPSAQHCTQHVSMTESTLFTTANPTTLLPSERISHETAARSVEWETLQVICLRVMARISEACSNKPRDNIVEHEWSPQFEERCVDFFSPVNCRRFLKLYFAAWHPNTPVIHKPTFEPSNALESLVAVMVLIGATLSPDPLHTAEARIWYTAVEQIIFSDAMYYAAKAQEQIHAREFSICTERRLTQLLQASYLVCILQSWEGTELAKKRVRRYRFSIVVAVKLARDMNIASLVHPEYISKDEDHFDWHGYIAREELIRTVYFVFVQDITYTIFNNFCPRMAAAEMKLNLCCPEACFQAETAIACFASLQQWKPLPLTKVSFNTILAAICRERLSGGVCTVLASSGPLNLFIITIAFHSMLFSQHQSCIGHKPQLLPVTLGIANWKYTWGSMWQMTPILTAEFSDSDLWRRIGFFRHAPEYNDLAGMMVQSLGNYHLNPYANLDPEGHPNASPHPALDRYDETSMKQVNSLLEFLEKFHF